jgi:hypothetical protein
VFHKSGIRPVQKVSGLPPEKKESKTKQKNKTEKKKNKIEK